VTDTPAKPLWGDTHDHPGCAGCQICFACLLDPDSPEYVDLDELAVALLVEAEEAQP
jgi:hypothetical protein